MWLKWAALAWLVAASLVTEPAPEVRVRSGVLRGRLTHHRRAHHYFGIPYATVNASNRFKAPLPPPEWEGVFDAAEEHVRCPQRMVGELVMGEVDCLRLNVYTPARAAPASLPVMVFIHGGSFLEGTGAGCLYGADDFPDYGVVFVSINYRLNVEGFLCLGIEEAPGNAGLKDQIAALKWIKENIRAFGGDPDNVTLFGESAGAVSTSYLIQSPAARGLFHRAILQSGSTLAPWAVQHDPIGTAASLAERFGHHTRDPHELYNILSNKTVEELISAIQYSQHKNYITADTLFVPCIEKELHNVEPVITQHSIELLQSGNYSDMPMIIGFNDNEGIYFSYKDYGSKVERVDVKEFLKNDLVFPSESAKNKTVEEIKELYFPRGRVLLEGVVDLYSDMLFKVPVILEAQMYAQSSQPRYYYVFQYSGWLNFPKLVTLWRWRGASHADELFYLFTPHAFPTPWRRLEAHMTSRLLTLWTNFAKYGEPTPPETSECVRWQAGDAGGAEGPQALLLDRSLASTALWSHANVHLWNRTYTAYRRTTYGFH